MHLTRQQARDLDQQVMTEFAIPGIVLMENAGRSMAELLLALGARGPVVVCCGKGNNGGDGFVIARHLNNAGVAVRVLLFARPEELHGDAAVNHGIVVRMGVPVVFAEAVELEREFRGADWIVDALFGSGLQGAVRPPFDRVIAAMNASERPIFAVDIPSGLDADTGEAVGATVRAMHTATVVAPKVGFTNPAAAEWLGTLHVVGFGVSVTRLTFW